MLVSAVLSFSSIALATEPKVLFTTGTMGIYPTPAEDAKSYGKVLVASRLEVLERRPNRLRVKLSGWHQDGAARILYALPGKRIMVAVLASQSTHRLVELNSIKDPDTDIVWKGVSFEGWIGNNELADDLETIWKSAWELFATRCTVCHQRRIPHKYTANQWVSLLKVMGPRTGLPKDKQRLILKFLQNHASDAAAPKTITKP